jgi:antitoxin component YwqK of YwqJK toxin-antitoxin module
MDKSESLHIDASNNVSYASTLLKNGDECRRYFHKNGLLARQDIWKQGKLCGECLIFNDQGFLIQKMMFLNNQLHGPMLSYKEDILEMYASYEDGLLHGVLSLFNTASGALSLTTNYTKGKINGTQTQFHDNGAPATTTVYYDGKRHGVYQQFFPLGILHKVGLYIQDKEEGQWMTYSQDGFPDMLMIYQQGRLTDQKTMIRAPKVSSTL